MAVFPGKPPNPLGLKVEINLASVWTDITKYVLQRDMLHITNMGRVDEASGIQAGQLTLTLKNQDARFTPKNSAGAYFPNIIRNTPIRVSVNAQSTSGSAYNGSRFYGQITSWPPTSDISQRDVYVQVTASGIWQQISQSSVSIGSAYSRYVAQLTGTSVPATSWTMEDGDGATVFATQIGAGAAATFVGMPSFAQDGTSFAGCDALPQFNGARVTANVSSGATATNNVVRFALAVPAAGDAITATFPGGGELCKILSPSATVKRYSVSLIGNQLVLQGFAATSGGAALFTGTISTKVNGVPVLVSVEITPSGGSINWALRIIKPGAGSALDQVTGTRATSTIAAVTQVFLNDQGRMGDSTFGELGVFYAVPSLVTAAAALGGFAGEFAVVRFQRLCTEFSIASEVIGSTSAAMGPQVDDTLSNQFQMIENTDGGLLYETTDQFGLGYRTLLSLQNQSVAVTLNYAAGQLGAPLAATYDLQAVKNQWAVANFDGYTSLATLTSGALSIAQVPNGIGPYTGQVTINAATHAQVDAIAKQRLFQGTVDDIRYPQVTTDLRRGAISNLFATVPALRVGDYLQITNLPAFEGASTAKQLAWGWEETLNAFTWSQVFNTVPELPFETTFSPGTFSVVQAPSGTVAAGSQVGSTVSGSQIGGGVAGGVPTATLSARSIGGMTSFISASTPYDWTFAVTGTPADVTYFTCTQDQALPVTIGDTFVNTGGLGGPFTVTSLDPPSGGNVNVHFTPDATSVMSTGSVQGGKEGDTWVNTSGGNQVNIWHNGAWSPVTWTGSSVIAASSITSGPIIAGKIAAGAIDGMTITGATIIADGASGELLIYSGAPAIGNLIASISGAAGNDSAITGGGGNSYAQGIELQQGGLVLDNQASPPTAVTNASLFYSSVRGRPRYLSQAGDDSVLERSTVNVSPLTVGNTITSTVVSADLLYLANEAAQSSEYEIEIAGNGTGNNQTLTFHLYIDGIAVGTNFTLGATVFTYATGLSFAYTVRMLVTVLSAGAGGTIATSSYGIFKFDGNVVGSSTTRGDFIEADISTSAAYDTTANHTIQIRANWGATATGQTMTTYRTKVARRM
jgi:hypothetical protein